MLYWYFYSSCNDTGSLYENSIKPTLTIGTNFDLFIGQVNKVLVQMHFIRRTEEDFFFIAFTMKEAIKFSYMYSREATDVWVFPTSKLRISEPLLSGNGI